MTARRWCAVLVAALVGASSALAAAPGFAVQVPHPSVVAERPAATTPHVLDGAVYGIVQVGSRMVSGGQFTSVESPDHSATYPRTNLMAFAAATGAVDPGFVPQVDGPVWALLPATDGTSVYVVGEFNTVNGVASKGVARLDVRTGAAVPGFSVPGINGVVRDVRMSGGRLYLGGLFTKVRGTARSAVAAVHPDTGRLDPFFDVPFAGPRNSGPLAVVKLDISPDGRRMVATGNFTSVGGQPRTQIAMVSLDGTAAAVDAWSTDRYLPVCASGAYDHYMRDVDWAPDGRYFVVVTTGAGFAGTLCDAAARWEGGRTGPGQQPTWVNYTGGDTLHSVAITGAVVYVGGHQRWMNNTYARDTLGPGGVPRSGIAALDPRNGLPLSWNPGRTRGVGARELYATPTGLWVGSDTDRFNGYLRGRIAYVPLAGGTALPADVTGTLPGDVFLAGPTAGAGSPDGLAKRRVDGTVGATVVLGGTGFSTTRGAFRTDNLLWTGNTDGTLRKQSFDGTTLGPQTVVDLNRITDFATELQTTTGMFFWQGRLYFTLPGQSTLYYRWFTPESGIASPERFVATGNLPDLDWRQVAGMTIAGDRLLWASSADGALRSVSFVGGVPVAGTTTVLSGPAVDGNDWRARGLFVRS